MAFVVGLTGGVATGKSTLARILRREGAAVLSLDEVAHRLYRPGTPLNRAIVREFGRGVSGRRGSIDRHALGSLVFSDPSALGRLNRLVHPPLRREALHAIRRMSSRGGLLVLEAGPVLAALRLLDQVDLPVLVTCPRKERIARLLDGRGLSESQAEALLTGTGGAERMLFASFRSLRKPMVVDSGGNPARLEAAACRIMSRSKNGNNVP